MFLNIGRKNLREREKNNQQEQTKKRYKENEMTLQEIYKTLRMMA